MMVLTVEVLCLQLKAGVAWSPGPHRLSYTNLVYPKGTGPEFTR